MAAQPGEQVEQFLPQLSELSHKNAIKHENSDFGGHFAPPAFPAFGALRGHCLTVSGLFSLQF